MAQVNFSISDELKAELDSLMKLSGAESKPEFMHQMILALNTHLANSVDIDIDLSKYESVNTQTKKDIFNVFKHLLTVLDNNFSTTKQEAIYLEQEKRLFVEQEKAFKDELEKIHAETNKKLLLMESDHRQVISVIQESKTKLDNKYIVLQSKNDELIRELKSVSSVAGQVQSVMAENKELREQIKSDTDSYRIEFQEYQAKYKVELDVSMQNIKSIQLQAKGLEKENFENSIKLNQANEQIEELKENASSQNQVIEATKAELNKALGKLEILKNESI